MADRCYAEWSIAAKDFDLVPASFDAPEKDRNDVFITFSDSSANHGGELLSDDLVQAGVTFVGHHQNGGKYNSATFWYLHDDQPREDYVDREPWESSTEYIITDGDGNLQTDLLDLWKTLGNHGKASAQCLRRYSSAAKHVFGHHLKSVMIAADQIEMMQLLIRSRRQIAIIESPYAGDVERNKRYLNACIRYCIKRGYTPYASHRMLTSALNDDDRHERNLGIIAGFPFRRMAAITFVFRDLGISRGMEYGIRDAESLPFHAIEYITLGDDWGDGIDLTNTEPLERYG